VCYDCDAKEKKDERENTMAEEAAVDEVAMEYFWTPETPSASHLAFAQTEMAAQQHSKKADGKHVRLFERQ
jgi:hypothetical protein